MLRPQTPISKYLWQIAGAVTISIIFSAYALLQTLDKRLEKGSASFDQNAADHPMIFRGLEELDDRLNNDTTERNYFLYNQQKRDTLIIK